MGPRLSTTLALAPVAILVVWLLAGQWQVASPEQRAWLQLTTALCVAILVPLPAVRHAPYPFFPVIRLWAWSTAAGLLMMA
jgi:hypothetical protein